MPKLFVVDTETTLADLVPTILRARTSAAVRLSAADAIRRANPGLDPDLIQPGTVVLLPGEVAVRTATDDADPVRQAADDLVARLRDGLETLGAASESAEEQRRSERQAADELLDSALVERLTANSPELLANIESLRSSMKQDDGEARRQLAGLQEARDGWAGELEELRALLLP